MKSTRLARTQNYDLNKIFKEKKEGNVSPKDLNLQLHQEKVTSYVTQRYNCLYLSIQNLNGYLKGLEKLNKAKQSSLIIYITVEPNPRTKG